MIVNDIFKSYLSGMSINEIAEHLNTIYPKENSKWNPRTIHAILRNEKYIGDSLYQKTYTTDSLPLKIVWRCVNRLEYGTKFCSHSPSIPEEELHQAILKAVQNLAANFTDEVAAQLDGILRQMKAGENLKAQLQKQLEKAQQEFDRLLEMSLELDESTPFLDDKLRKLSGKIKILKANIAESTDGKGEDEEATKQLTAQDLLIKEYYDILTARIIEKVIVHSRQEIEIYFIGGYTQKIDLI